ncbi:MAG: hypothetical protein AB7T49_04770 [Oligoflexales bacterium]
MFAHLRDLKIVLLAFLNVMAISCRTGSDHSTTEGFVESRGGDFPLWPNPDDIPVCWKDDFVITQAFKDEVRRFVTRKYGEVGFHFTGWGPCIQTDRLVVQVKIRDGQPGFPGTPNVSGLLGTKVNPVFGPVVYLDHAPYWNKDTNEPKRGVLTSILSCPAEGALNCIRNYALHEFGHVLGLHHEANRRDNNCKYAQHGLIDSENEDGTQIGDYDSKSIMNYCQNIDDIKTGREPKLSELDVLTLKAYYQNPMVKIVLVTQITKPGQEKVTIIFKGKSSTSVKYGIGDANLDCKLEESYGKAVSVTETVTVAARSSDNSEIKICARGGNKNEWQSLQTYSVIYLPKHALM